MTLENFTRRLLRPFLVGAILAVAARLLLVAPADLYAWRVAGGGWWVAGSGPAIHQPPSTTFKSGRSGDRRTVSKKNSARKTGKIVPEAMTNLKSFS